MNKTMLFLMVLGLSLISAHSIRAFDFKDQPIVEGITNCAPLNTVNVTLTNDDIHTPCTDCPTWYVSVWEWDGSSGYQQIGSSKPFSNGPTYTWTGLPWNYTNYQCLVLIWHYVDTNGQGGCGFTTNDKVYYKCWSSNPPTSWSVTDFYPCS